MNDKEKGRLSAVSAVTFLYFWMVKLAAAAVGETGGDTVSMSMGLGYLVSAGVFGGVFLFAVTARVKARESRAGLYWPTVIATTIAGTTLADVANRLFRIGYVRGLTLLLAMLFAVAAAWRLARRQDPAVRASWRHDEVFYWVTTLLAQTFGAAVGDWAADLAGGLGAALVLGGLFALALALYTWSTASRTGLFWLALAVTMPFGSVLGDLLAGPERMGGFDLRRIGTTAALLGLIVLLTSLAPPHVLAPPRVGGGVRWSGRPTRRLQA